ncbi:MAG: hypothetical protein HJJLKODD_01921 [Phycisphaerae bacterium]|nr:hypothetical protein [Phycisphaerae bacterium]
MFAGLKETGMSTMTTEEFVKHQYMTLREEIRASKSRMFWLLIICTALVSAMGFIAFQYRNMFASASMPFLILVLMVSFIVEQHTVIRAGRYIKEHIEPNLKDITGWENWLASSPRFRDVERYFFGSFLIVFFIFYGVASGLAVESLSSYSMEHGWYAGVGYVVAGMWFVVVLIRHWHACTTT